MVKDLKEYFKYDENVASCLVRIKDTYSSRNKKTASAGEMAGSVQKDYGYYQFSFYMKKYFCHRVIWEIFNGPIEEGYNIDHVDGNRLNNKISNLRLVTIKQNMRNSLSRKDSSKGGRGVNLQNTISKQGKLFQYWRARYFDLEGIEHGKSFSVEKHGFDEAFRLALEYRKKMIEELNLNGAGYTDRHGK